MSQGLDAQLAVGFEFSGKDAQSPLWRCANGGSACPCPAAGMNPVGLWENGL
jgi:hypothetical protein